MTHSPIQRKVNLISTRLLLAASLVAAIPTGARAVTWFVDADATGAGTGMSWADAFADLQAALAVAAAGDQVWVAAGTYVPGATIQATYQLKSGVALYGGFAGTETSLEQRDPAANPVILSGDVGRDDVYGYPVWYLGWNINTPNSIHVVNGSGVDSSAILDGFTIMAGYATQNFGGGLYVNGGSPTVVNCTITRNLAGFASGGGVYVNNGSPAFVRCGFVQNYVHLGQGAGVMLYGASGASFTDCDFLENRCVGAASGGEGAGAGLSCWSSLPVNLTRCTFRWNQAVSFYPSGDYGGTYGGGIHHFGPGALAATSCTFEDNFSNNGGAVWCWRDATLVNCLFIGNQAPEYHGQQGGWGGAGGGIGGYSFVATTITAVNCSFVANSAQRGGGMRFQNMSNGVVSNCILWGNTDEFGAIGPSQISGSGARYSCIQNMLVGIPGEDPPDPKDFPNCIALNPVFVNPAARDLHLQPASPCIDAADNGAVPGDVTYDLDGKPRFVDKPDTPDSGAGAPPMVDMGAYEWQMPPVTGDMNCDGAFNAGDVAPFVLALTDPSGYAKTYPECDLLRGDLTADGRVDGGDVPPFVALLISP